MGSTMTRNEIISAAIATVEEIRAEFVPNPSTRYMGIAVIVTGILVLYIEKAKKTNIFKFVHGNIYAGFSGVLNAAVNLSMLFLAAQIPAAILYPTVTAGGIVLAFIVSIFFYKERLSLLQYIGYTAGVVAVILLNL